MSGDTWARWTVPEGLGSPRLDKYAADHLDWPRNRITRRLDDGKVLLDGKPAKGSAKVRAGQSVAVDMAGTAAGAEMVPEDGELEILHQDSDVVVLIKPAGLAVHPGAGRDTGTLAHRLIHHFPEMIGVGGPGRPGIVHRLDLDTTGVMVLARSDRAYRRLSTDFAERQVEKFYLAVVHGRVKETMKIDLPIGRHPQDRKKMTIRPEGRPSVSHLVPLAHRDAVASAVRVGLETGRTHQIRVHMKAVRHPLVGDPLYGEARWKGAPKLFHKTLERFPRPALHAHRLAFSHPADQRPMVFEAPVPADMAELWRKLSGDPWPAD